LPVDFVNLTVTERQNTGRNTDADAQRSGGRFGAGLLASSGSRPCSSAPYTPRYADIAVEARELIGGQLGMFSGQP